MKKLNLLLAGAFILAAILIGTGCSLVDDTLHPWPSDDPRWPSSGGGESGFSWND